MKMSSFWYLVKQGWKSMFANRLMTLASFGVLSACLVITGIAALITVNVNSFMDYLGSQNTVEVYLNDDITPEQISSIESILFNSQKIDKYDFISKENAVVEMQSLMEESASLFTQFEGENNPGNPFPASFRISAKDPLDVPEVMSKMAELGGVNDVLSALDTAEILAGLKQAVSVCGWSLVLVLGIVSIVVISNTIRLTVFARRKEINIMKFVGATNSFIRMPFFVEGVTVGALAGGLSTAVVIGAYYAIIEYINTIEASLFTWLLDCILPIAQVWPYLLCGFLIFGVIIGSIGTTTSIRKHLKV